MNPPMAAAAVADAPALQAPNTVSSIGMVSTFPPTACGLATFAAALATGLERNGAHDIGIVSVGSPQQDSCDPRVMGALDPSSKSSRRCAAGLLADSDVVLLQHEYGIYGPEDGIAVLDLISSIDAPVITTLHSVPAEPTRRQRSVLEAVVADSDATVTMTWSARSRLVDGYSVDPAKLVSIPHGATIVDAPVTTRRGLVLTWGLLGPGKGIEWVIDALAAMDWVEPRPNYLVAGATHPNILLRDGDVYRDMLRRRSHDRGVADQVTLDPAYRSLHDLVRLVASAEVVVLPYDSTDQVTSGVLVDAIAAGVPVVATAFPHASELLSDGAGIVVPHRDPAAIAAAVGAILTRPHMRASMIAAGRPVAERHCWERVAGDYLLLAERSRLADADRAV